MSTHRTWKTSRRGEQRPPVSSSTVGSTTSSAVGGDFLSSSASDLNNKLDFLDSVLGDTATAPIGGSGSSDENGDPLQTQQQQQQQPSERLRSEDVDPILELVNGVNYDKMTTAGTAIAGLQEKKGIVPATTTTPDTARDRNATTISKKPELSSSSATLKKKSGTTTANNNKEPLFSSELPSGIVSRASTSSLRRSEKSTDDNTKNNNTSSSFGGSHTTPTRNLHVSLSHKSADNLATTAAAAAMTKDPKQQAQVEGADGVTADGENMPPIPYLGTEQQDDDSLSQITSSIASQSFYDSMFGGSSSRGSQPRAGAAGQKKRSMASENSYADTLDEIADMLHPDQQQQQQKNGVPNRNNKYRNNNGNNYNNHRTSRTTTPFDDLYNRPASERYNQYHYNTTSNNRNQTIMAALTLMVSKLDPAFSKLRLQTRYIQSRIANWRSNIDMSNNKSKKTDGEDAKNNNGTEKDYYSMLMSSGGSQQSSTTGPRRMTRAQRRQHHINTAIALFVVFVGMTMILMALRVAMSNIPHRQKKKGPVGAAGGSGSTNVRGGMAHGGMAHGGMAHGGMAGGLNSNSNNNLAVASSGGGGAMKNSGFSHSEHIGVSIPEFFDNLSDIDVPPVRGVDVPFFWHIPRTGGGTMNDILGGCLYLTLASDAGGNGDGSENDSLKVTKFPKHFSYVNVDTSSPEGIERARKLGLAESGLADVVVGTLLHEVSTIFTEENKGRMFTMFRHPVDRAVSLFHFVQDTQWRNRETFQKELSSLTIEEFFKGGLAENNWMTRFLTGELTKGQLTTEDLSKAKEILRRKVLVGLLTEKGESFSRFEKYFGWQLKSDSEQDCHEKKLQWAWPLKHRHDDVDEGSALWDLIVAHNIYDMELYEYAEVLFHEQGSIFDKMV